MPRPRSGVLHRTRVFHGRTVLRERVRDMTIKVLLVDDERLIRAGLAAIINAEEDLAVVGEASDGAEVPDAVARLRPDVILMDVRMPRLDGIQATRHILDTVREPPKIIVVTTFENDEYVYDALKAGANGFLLKRTRPEEILQAVRMVAHGDTLLFPAAIRELAAAHGPSPAGGRAARWHGELTEREADVLRLVAKGRSNAEIAGELFVSPQTVKTHVGNILAKLQARDRTQAVILAYETGFITPG
ncbi:response regulator transcription factor [Actinomadura nitritigenes]